MTDIIARCLNTVEPCTGFAPLCNSEQHRQRVEESHMHRFHATVTADDIGDDMWSRHGDERALIIKAIEATAVVNGGKVDMNVVRQLLDGSAVTPQLVGAVVNVLLRQGRLERIGWTTNTDKRGRNVGKPLPLYALVGSDAGRSVTT